MQERDAVAILKQENGKTFIANESYIRIGKPLVLLLPDGTTVLTSNVSSWNNCNGTITIYTRYVEWTILWSSKQHGFNI